MADESQSIEIHGNAGYNKVILGWVGPLELSGVTLEAGVPLMSFQFSPPARSSLVGVTVNLSLSNEVGVDHSQLKLSLIDNLQARIRVGDRILNLGSIRNLGAISSIDVGSGSIEIYPIGSMIVPRDVSFALSLLFRTFWVVPEYKPAIGSQQLQTAAGRAQDAAYRPIQQVTPGTFQLPDRLRRK